MSVTTSCPWAGSKAMPIGILTGGTSEAPLTVWRSSPSGE